MQLLTGPAGSGKSWSIVERFRQALRLKDSGVVLVVPTATMAQHLQNQLAREGFVFQPSLIRTLSRFIEPWAEDLPEISQPGFYLLVERVIHRLNRPEFAKVAHTPGFCASLASVVEELSSAGCGSARLASHAAAAPLGEAFLAVYREVERELAGRSLRAGRLMRAAERIDSAGPAGVRTVLMDGFFSLTDPELAVVQAIAKHAEITVTLPAGEITEPTRQRLLSMGFTEHRSEYKGAEPERELVVASNMEREADEIARRVLDEVASGRKFQEIGVIARNGEAYAPLLEGVFERFGIPARSYFDAELKENSAVRFLAGIVDAMLAGWDHIETLTVIRLAPHEARFGVMDSFDFRVRSALPGRGLEALKPLAADDRLVSLLEKLAALEPWRAAVLAPAEWACRLKTLRSLYRPRADLPVALARAQATALEQFDTALDEAARFLDGAPAMRLVEFWPSVKSALRLLPLRVPDQRRNVVHLLSAYEARQWRLPVMFVCGLVEKQFPMYHAPDPFLPDGIRRDLQRAGIRVRTAADRELEEEFLFDSAVTRATGLLVLSYPRADARGDPNLPSLFLTKLNLEETEPLSAVRPAPLLVRESRRPAVAIRSAELLPLLPRKISASGIESFRRCAFQFFGRSTLHLEPAPKRPDQRLDFLAQGNILHCAIAQWHARGGPIEPLFEQAFEEICAKCAIPRTWRTEYLRLQMLEDAVRFARDPQRVPFQPPVTEKAFEVEVAPGATITCRIDRIDTNPDGSVVVVDYKYSGKSIREIVDNPCAIQGQAYAMAAEASAMYYCRIKGEVEYGGWEHITRQWLEEGRAVMTSVTSAIAAGNITPHPFTIENCRTCDFRDVCRFEQGAEEALAGGA